MFRVKLLTSPYTQIVISKKAQRLERLNKNCHHTERGFLSFSEWCQSSPVPIIGGAEGAGLNIPVTACLAVALAKAGAETMPKPKKTALIFPQLRPSVFLSTP
jgi:hypothetical protein